MKPDKFDIFGSLVVFEANCNHSGTYVSVGQLSSLMIQVNRLYTNWDESLTFDENMRKVTCTTANRSVSPLGETGQNKI